jgi:hypothetical protein
METEQDTETKTDTDAHSNPPIGEKGRGTGKKFGSIGSIIVAIIAGLFFYFTSHDSVPDGNYGGGYAHTTQGSETYPYAWYKVLEQYDSETLFSDNLERYSLIPDATDPDNNPLGLPIGLTITKHEETKKEAIGMSCAACHMSRIEYQGKSVLIEGGSGMFDSTRFFNDLYLASMQTIEDPDKRVRFLKRYIKQESELGGFFGIFNEKKDMEESGVFTQLFLQEVEKLFEHQVRSLDQYFEDEPYHGPLDVVSESSDDNGELKDLDLPEIILTRLGKEIRLARASLQFIKNFSSAEFGPETHTGPGRVDAFGKVRNLILPLVYGKDVVKPATAPVSIPALWLTKETEWLHWNGNTNSAMQRNILEALGSGAMVELTRYDSTVDFEKLDELEKMVRNFQAPKWPVDMFGPLDADRIARGKVIYEGGSADYEDYKKGNCAECHDSAERTAGGFLIYPQYSLAEIGTDPNHAQNFNRLVGSDGVFPDIIEGLAEKIKTRYYAENQIPVEQQEEWENNRENIDWRSPIDAPLPGRPLSGVWSTAPYLHNGSVPTLHHLLSPVSERPVTFPIGHWEYDPELVGYQLDATNAPFTFNVREVVSDAAGNTYPELPNGNSNAGHEYGIDLSAEERLDLIEYLKSL